MDFEPRYTSQQQEFRSDVRNWLSDNLPDGLEYPADSDDLTLDGYLKLRQLGGALDRRDGCGRRRRLSTAAAVCRSTTPL